MKIAFLDFYGIKGRNNDEIFKYIDLVDVVSSLN